MPFCVSEISLFINAAGNSLSSIKKRTKFCRYHAHSLTSQLVVHLDEFLSVQAVHDKVVEAIDRVSELKVQYFSIVDGKSLADVASWDESGDIVGCITVFCGSQPIRLIDHIRYKG